MTRRTDRRIALLVGGCLALLFTVMSAVQVAGWSIGTVERTAERVIPGPIEQLRLDAGSSDVTILPAIGDDVTIDSRASGSLRTPRLEATAEGGHVRIEGGCPEITFGDCSASIVVHVPAGTAVEVEAASGDIDAQGLTRGADLRTASGDISVRGLSGGMELESASGDVEAYGLRSSLARASTASGDVELRFLEAPSAAEAETSSGDVRIIVPADDHAYAVDVETRHGKREIGVDTDTQATRLLRAKTSSGDATVDYAG